MAMTAAERKKLQLERERQALLPLSDSTYPYLRQRFFEFWEDYANTSDVDLSLEAAGMEPLYFKGDDGPEAYAGEDAFPTEEIRLECFKGSEGSIGRAEVLVDSMLQAATHLAHAVNLYKTDELQTRLREIERSDLPDEASRKEAFAKAAQISKLLAELEKNVRVTLPKWRVKGL